MLYAQPMTTRTEVSKKQAGDAPLGIGISLIVLSVIFGVMAALNGVGFSPAALFMLVIGAVLTVVAYLIRLRR